MFTKRTIVKITAALSIAAAVGAPLAKAGVNPLHPTCFIDKVGAVGWLAPESRNPAPYVDSQNTLAPSYTRDGGPTGGGSLLTVDVSYMDAHNPLYPGYGR
jgi:hypothetical protein